MAVRSRRGWRSRRSGATRRSIEIASAYEIPPSQVAKWKAEALARLPEVLADGRQAKTQEDSETQARLYQEIGRLTMEVEYLKKKLGLCRSDNVVGGLSSRAVT